MSIVVTLVIGVRCQGGEYS